MLYLILISLTLYNLHLRFFILSLFFGDKNHSSLGEKGLKICYAESRRIQMLI